MRGTPVRHHISLESQLSFQHTVQYLAVFASVGLVQAVVAAHHRNSRLHSSSEGPKVQFVQCAIVHITRYCLDGRVASFRCTGIPLSLLFISNVMLATGLNSRLLHALDGESHDNSSEVRIW
jgi:hypothetical protein